MFGISMRRPTWDIAEAFWVDYATNPRFALWSAGTLQSADDAVLDKETGLVWERSPAIDKKSLSAAVVYSATKVVARRKGWRLPALEELLSLVDPTNNNPTLPAQNPFLHIQLDDFYWSMSQGMPLANDPATILVWGYNFGDSSTSEIVVAQAQCYTWLVRGGYGHNYPR